MTTARYNRVSFQEVATFATTAPSSLSTMSYIPAIDPAPPKLDQMRDEGNETSNDGLRSPFYSTARSCSFDATTRVYTGSKNLSSSGSDATACYAQPLLESYFGAAANSSAGFVVQAGSNATTIVLTNTSTIAVGEAVMLGGSGTDGEVRFVTANDTNTNSLTLDSALSTAANYATNAECYCAFNFVPTLGAYAKHIYFNWEGGGSGHQFLLGPGKVTSAKLTQMATREGLRYAFSFLGDTWADGVTSGTAPTATFTSAPLVAVGSPWTMSGTDVRVSDLEVDFGVKHEELAATSGTNGRSGWEITEVAPTGSFTAYTLAATWQGYMENATTSGGLRFVCSVPTAGHAAKSKGTVAIYIPRPQYRTEQAVGNGQRAHKVSWEGKRPSDAQIAAGLTSPIYFAVFGGE